VARVRDRLAGVYGVPRQPPHGEALSELVLTVLSQSTSDRNRDVAFLRLRERFGSWEAVRDAPVAEVEAAIRPGGLSRVKSGRIVELLGALGDDLRLEALRDLPLPEARARLTALPGVGRKTAACVLLFAFGRHDVPVDTHTWAGSARASRSCVRAPGRTSCTTRWRRSRRAARRSSST
jgi:endonuclease-3